MEYNSINKGVLLAGGFGTRFLPFTAGVSKTMLPIVDKPTIAHIVDEFIYSHITNILIIVGYNKDNIISYFEKMTPLINMQYKKYCYAKKNTYSPIRINFAIQKNQCGTANAVLQAEKFIKNDDFAVACGDELFINTTPVLTQLINVYKTNHSAVVACKILPKIEATKFGVLDANKINAKLYTLKNIIEKPPIEKIKTPLVNLGRYILPNCIFDYIKQTPKNSSGEYALTNSLIDLSKDSDVYCYKFNGTHYDIGNKIGYAKAFIDFALKNDITKNDIKTHILNKINFDLK